MSVKSYSTASLVALIAAAAVLVTPAISLASSNRFALQPKNVSRTAVLQLAFDCRWNGLHGPANTREDAAIARFAAWRPAVFHDQSKISHLRPFINESHRRALASEKAILDAPNLLHLDLGIGQHIGPAAQRLAVEQLERCMSRGWTRAGRYDEKERCAQAPCTLEFAVLICHSGALLMAAICPITLKTKAELSV